MRPRVCLCDDCMSGVPLKCEKKPWLGPIDMWAKVMNDKNTYYKNKEWKLNMGEVNLQVDKTKPDLDDFRVAVEDEVAS